MPHRRRATSARRIIVSAFVGGLLAFVVRERIAAFYRIPSASMLPTLLVGDLVLTDRLSFRSGMPRPGDVVVFERVGAEGERESFAKRVVAIEGQTVSFRGRALVVDGVPVARSLLGEAQFDASGDPVGHASFFFESEAWSESIGAREWRILQRRTAPVPSPGPWSVPSGHVFVLGDNRDDSIDSRDPSFGAVPVEAIVGRVRWVAFSRRNAGGWRLERTGIPVP
jgi:signal peptidase I